MAPFRSNVRFFDALTAFLIALCLHMVLGMLWERGARHAQRKWSCYYVLTPSSPIFKRVDYPVFNPFLAYYCTRKLYMSVKKPRNT